MGRTGRVIPCASFPRLCKCVVAWAIPQGNKEDRNRRRLRCNKEMSGSNNITNTVSLDVSEDHMWLAMTGEGRVFRGCVNLRYKEDIVLELGP